MYDDVTASGGGLHTLLIESDVRGENRGVVAEVGVRGAPPPGRVGVRDEAIVFRRGLRGELKLGLSTSTKKEMLRRGVEHGLSEPSEWCLLLGSPDKLRVAGRVG